MIEIYNAFVRELLRRILEAASITDAPVVYSPSPTMDAQLVQKFHQSKSEEKVPLAPFVAYQQTPAPETLPRCQPNKPGFVLAKKYKEQGLFLGAEATLVSVPYQVRGYFESLPQKYAFLEAILINHPRLNDYGLARIYFLEDYQVTVSYRFEAFDYDREIDASIRDQFQLHTLSYNLILEVPIFGKPYPGKLLRRPVIVFEDPDKGIEEFRVEFED